MTSEFVRTTAIDKILELTKRKRVIKGGTSAAKTFGIIATLIDVACENPGIEISVISESVPHLRRGALKDFLKIMKITLRYKEERYNKTLLKYTFKNGAYMEFFSAQDERGARRDILFINECIYITFEQYHHYAIRTNGTIFLDFNPANKFWVDDELLGESDVEELVLTYLDNEALEQSIVDDIEKAREKSNTSAYWANWWRVYGLGLLGTLQGVIFDDYEIVPNIPEGARSLGYGLDFGYTNDPSALVELFKYNDTIIFDELIYRTGLTNPDISNEMQAVEMDIRFAEIIADSAEPKSIEEIGRLGWTIYPCVKGPDSIIHGIQLLQQYRFLVTERSVNIIKELRSYMWDTDKSGAKTGKPIKLWNHAIDAMRYIAGEKLSGKAEASKTTVGRYSGGRRNR